MSGLTLIPVHMAIEKQLSWTTFITLALSAERQHRVRGLPSGMLLLSNKMCSIVSLAINYHKVACYEY